MKQKTEPKITFEWDLNKSVPEKTVVVSLGKKKMTYVNLYGEELKEQIKKDFNL